MVIILDGPSGSEIGHTVFKSPYGLAFLITEDIFPESSASEESAAGQLQVQVYNFTVYLDELLDATSKPGKNSQDSVIRDSEEGKLEVANYREGAGTAPKIDPEVVSTKEEFALELERVFKHHVVRKTTQNKTSSRGHRICQLRFSRSSTAAPTSELFLVDLAGPEDYDKSPSKKETGQINEDRGELKRCREQKIPPQQRCFSRQKSDEMSRQCKITTVG